MITLDDVRTALGSPDPYTQLDLLVRAEQTAGWKVADIIEQFRPLVDPALDTPGLTADGEEALLGTLDALQGNCRQSQCYVDPPPVMEPQHHTRG